MKKIVISIFVFSLIYFVIRRAIEWVKFKIESNHLGNQNDIEKASNLIASMLYSVLMIFNFLILLQILGIDVAILMGWVGLGFAFSLENIIANVISGIVIILNKKFTIGDLIEIQGSVNMVGTVENITLRYTVIKSFDRRKTVIPNTELAKSPFKTIKSEKYIRGEMEFHVPRHVNIPQIKQLIIRTINQDENIVRKEYTSSIVSKFDERGIELKAFFLVDPKISSTGFGTKTAIRKAIQEIFKHYGIKAPYFHITLNT